MKRIIKEYFTFSRKERVAAIILLLLIVFFLSLPYLFEPKKSKPVIEEELQQQVLKWKQNEKQNDSVRSKADITFSETAEPTSVLFDFDPNTLGADGWKRLGIQDKIIHIIFNYRSKGGKFYKPDDIRKIWGLQKIDADRIIPYARIANTENRLHQNNFNNQSTVAEKNIGIVDINTATIEQLMQLPGIGHSLPYRIINFRERVGGFWRLEQLKETYGMTDSIYQIIIPYLKTESSTIKKININSATDYELSKNPFISKDVAKAIVIFRNQHGKFAKLDDLKKIIFITEETYLKIVPYLKIE